MAEPRRTRGRLQVHVDYLFDRFARHEAGPGPYGILVPVRERPVVSSVKEFDHEDGSNLRTVSSEQQREANTIASQTTSLIEFAQKHDLEVPKEWVFEDDGYSGATLERPGLERVRDLAAEGRSRLCWRTHRTG